MSVQVTPNTAIATPALFRPRASVVVSPANAEAVVTVPVSAVSYVEIIVGASLDTTGRYKFIADTAAVLDATAISSSKTLTDVFGLASSLRFAFAKQLADSVSTVDAFAHAVAKQLADAYGTSDALVRDVVKRAFDSFGLTDADSYALEKLLVDGVGMNDAFDTTDGSLYTFTKSVINVVFANEQLTRDVGKKLADSVAMLSAPALTVTKAPFEDAVALDDTSVRQVELGKTDSVSAPDAQVLDVTKLLVDAFAVAELVGMLISKPLSDAAWVADTVALDVALPQTDAVSMLDAESYAIDKLLGDSVGFTDTVTTLLLFLRDFTDTTAATDAHAADISKPFAHSTSAIDVLTRGHQRALFDGVGMSDNTGVGDGIAFALTRSIANVVFAPDSMARQTALLKSHAASVADSGSLINQGYCDLTFFAEDYVGAARSF